MRSLYLIVFLVLSILLSNCKNRKSVDLSPVESYISFTDSLNTLLSDKYNYTLTKIYTLTEDSILADSISKLVILPDTLGFYEYLRYNINELDNILYLSQQEIFFVKDQLDGLKEDVKAKQISNIQYELQLESQKKMIELVEELIDSNLAVIKEIANSLYINSGDSIRNE